jgi:hypothetical protein
MVCHTTAPLWSNMRGGLTCLEEELMGSIDCGALPVHLEKEECYSRCRIQPSPNRMSLFGKQCNAAIRFQ